MGPSTPPALKLLTASTILYMVISLLAGLVAIDRNLPAEFAGFQTEQTVTQAFLFGMGTAISPPFYTLILQAVLLLLAYRTDGWGIFGLLGLALIGLLTFIGALGEPINLQIFSPATLDPLQALMMAAEILLSLAILVLALMEWGRRKEMHSTKN